MSTVAPCAGMWDLFDSIEPGDHYEAAKICATCPIIDACRERLAVARADALLGPKAGIKYGPQGTWAGEAVGNLSANIRHHRLLAEERMFSEDEARTAHANWCAGFRDDRTVVGERVYQRRKKRELTARRAA